MSGQQAPVVNVAGVIQSQSFPDRNVNEVEPFSKQSTECALPYARLSDKEYNVRHILYSEIETEHNQMKRMRVGVTSLALSRGKKK